MKKQTVKRSTKPRGKKAAAAKSEPVNERKQQELKQDYPVFTPLPFPNYQWLKQGDMFVKFSMYDESETSFTTHHTIYIP